MNPERKTRKGNNKLDGLRGSFPCAAEYVDAESSMKEGPYFGWLIPAVVKLGILVENQGSENSSSPKLTIGAISAGKGINAEMP